MTRATLIRGLTRALLRRVPAEHRNEARVLLGALSEQYSILITETGQRSFQNGFKAAELSHADSQYKEAWQRGHDDGIKDVMGRTAATAVTHPIAATRAAVPS